MDVTVPPYAERTVTITMTETEAKILKQLMGKVTGINLDEWVRKCVGVLRDDASEVTNDLYSALVNMLGDNPYPRME
jgi:hypothetical protein